MEIMLINPCFNIKVEAVLTEPKLLESVVALLWDDDMKVVKEACWVLSNSTSLHDPGHIQSVSVQSKLLIEINLRYINQNDSNVYQFSIILQHNIIPPLIHHLRNPSTPCEILNKILDTLVNVLSVGESPGTNTLPDSHNEYAVKLASLGVVEALIETWNNTVQGDNIKEKVLGLLGRWFYDYLPRNEHSDAVEDDGIDMASIEERVSRMSIMGGVDVF